MLPIRYTLHIFPSLVQTCNTRAQSARGRDDDAFPKCARERTQRSTGGLVILLFLLLLLRCFTRRTFVCAFQDFIIGRNSLRERRTQRRAVCSKALSGLPEPKRVLGGTPRFACHRVGGVDRDGAEREREKDSHFFLFFLGICTLNCLFFRSRANDVEEKKPQPRDCESTNNSHTGKHRTQR